MQPKLKISSPGDCHEKEADKVSSDIMATPGLSPDINQFSSPGIQKTSSNGFSRTESSSGGFNNLGTGRQLAPDTRGFFEGRFNRDFGGVRIHNNDRSAGLANSINARAFTYGSDIVFNKGEYRPGTAEGNKLLAHELTHVVQQNQNSNNIISRQEKNEEKMYTWSDSYKIPKDLSSGNGFKGCSPEQEDLLIHDISAARNAVEFALLEIESFLDNNLSNKDANWKTSQLFEKYFLESGDREYVENLYKKFKNISKKLKKGRSNWKCLKSKKECEKICPKASIACAVPGKSGYKNPVKLCPSHFERNVGKRVVLIIHEAAHQAGVTSGKAKELYLHNEKYEKINKRSRKNMADTYSGFVGELIGLLEPVDFGSKQSSGSRRKPSIEVIFNFNNAVFASQSILINSVEKNDSLFGLTGESLTLPDHEMYIGFKFAGLKYSKPGTREISLHHNAKWNVVWETEKEKIVLFDKSEAAVGPPDYLFAVSKLLKLQPGSSGVLYLEAALTDALSGIQLEYSQKILVNNVDEGY